MAIPVGSAIGFGIGAAIGSWLGWRWAFYAVVLPGILLGILCLLRSDPRRHAVTTDLIKPKFRIKDYIALFRIRSYLLNTAAMTAMTFAIGGISFWMPRYLTEVRGLPAASKIWFGAITAVAGLFATLLGGMAGDGLRNRGVGGAYFIVSGIGILIAAPCVILMLYIPFPFAWLAAFAAVFWLFFNTGPSNTAVANVTRPSMRASAFALNILVIHTLGDAISPSLLGATAGTFSWNAAFFLVAAVMALAGALWLWGARYLQADTLAAEADLATTDRPISDIPA
jgi:predicted MFS family arabinose efflux permease